MARRAAWRVYLINLLERQGLLLRAYFGNGKMIACIYVEVNGACNAGVNR